MTKKQGRAILSIGLFAWSLFGGVASAQGLTTIHPYLRGIWSLENCKNDAGFLIANGTVAVLVERGDATSWSLATDADPDDTGWLTGRDEDQSLIFFRRITGSPDILEMTTAADARGDASVAERPGSVPDPSVWNVERAIRCPSLPPGPQALYGEMFAVLEALDGAETACAVGPQPCATALFSVGDVNPNGSLNTAEISRLLRALVQLGSIKQGNGDADKQAGIVAASLPLAPILARALISSFDYDGDDGLSLEEFLRDRVALPSSDMSQILTGAESQVLGMMDTLESRASDLGRLLRMMR